MSLSEAKSQVRQFLAARYPVNLGYSPAGAPEKGAMIDVLISDLENEA